MRNVNELENQTPARWYIFRGIEKLALCTSPRGNKGCLAEYTEILRWPHWRNLVRSVVPKKSLPDIGSFSDDLFDAHWRIPLGTHLKTLVKSPLHITESSGALYTSWLLEHRFCIQTLVQSFWKGMKKLKSPMRPTNSLPFWIRSRQNTCM